MTSGWYSTTEDFLWVQNMPYSIMLPNHKEGMWMLISLITNESDNRIDNDNSYMFGF